MADSERGGHSSETVAAVDLLRFNAGAAGPVRERAEAVVEALVPVWIEGAGRFVLSCTPIDIEALAAGFAFTEGFISSAEDIAGVGHPAEDPAAVEVHLKRPAETCAGRNLLVTSSCGMCGVRNVEKYLTGEMACGRAFHTTPAELIEMGRTMKRAQGLFTQTGATHAAAIFRAGGEIVAFGEDLGRHNALDKAIGKCLLARKPSAGCGVMLSGRVSFELAAKAARAGIELVAAVSAPTSLAIAVADRCRITLCGFVREDRVSAYTHPERIMEGMETP
jgi:FdhD protein